jgi:hypothetical protein
MKSPASWKVGSVLSFYGTTLFMISTAREKNQTQRIAVFGASRAGKSTYICSHVKQLRKRHPKLKIILLSSKIRNASLDGIGELTRWDCLDPKQSQLSIRRDYLQARE